MNPINLRDSTFYSLASEGSKSPARPSSSLFFTSSLSVFFPLQCWVSKRNQEETRLDSKTAASPSLPGGRFLFFLTVARGKKKPNAFRKKGLCSWPTTTPTDHRGPFQRPLESTSKTPMTTAWKLPAWQRRPLSRYYTQRAYPEKKRQASRRRSSLRPVTHWQLKHYASYRVWVHGDVQQLPAQSELRQNPRCYRYCSYRSATATSDLENKKTELSIHIRKKEKKKENISHITAAESTQEPVDCFKGSSNRGQELLRRRSQHGSFVLF